LTVRDFVLIFKCAKLKEVGYGANQKCPDDITDSSNRMW
jgi:hypothetical protein